MAQYDLENYLTWTYVRRKVAKAAEPLLAGIAVSRVPGYQPASSISGGLSYLDRRIAVS
jgi:hypothetical protein